MGYQDDLNDTWADLAPEQPAGRSRWPLILVGGAALLILLCICSIGSYFVYQEFLTTAPEPTLPAIPPTAVSGEAGAEAGSEGAPSASPESESGATGPPTPPLAPTVTVPPSPTDTSPVPTGAPLDGSTVEAMPSAQVSENERLRSGTMAGRKCSRKFRRNFLGSSGSLVACGLPDRTDDRTRFRMFTLLHPVGLRRTYSKHSPGLVHRCLDIPPCRRDSHFCTVGFRGGRLDPFRVGNVSIAASRFPRSDRVQAERISGVGIGSSSRAWRARNSAVVNSSCACRASRSPSHSP